MMLTYALIAFAVAAVGGLLLAASVLRGRLAPWALSLVHALLGAAGLVMLVLVIMKGAGTLATTALVILVVAALGGFYLASQHAKGVVAPKSIVFVHAGAAVVGFLTLVGAVLQA
jgi:hypothetical protein